MAGLLVGAGAAVAIGLALVTPSDPSDPVRTAVPPVAAVPAGPPTTIPTTIPTPIPPPVTAPPVSMPPANPPAVMQPPVTIAQPDFANLRWERYENTRYGVRLEYPADLFEMGPAPPDNAGRGFEADSIDARISVYSHANALDMKREALLEEDVTEIGDPKPQRMPRNDGHVVIGIKEGRMVVRRVLLSQGGTMVHRLEVSYPTEIAKRFEPVLGRIVASFAADPRIPEAAANAATETGRTAPPATPRPADPPAPKADASPAAAPAQPPATGWTTWRLGEVAFNAPASWRSLDAGIPLRVGGKAWSAAFSDRASDPDRGIMLVLAWKDDAYVFSRKLTDNHILGSGPQEFAGLKGSRIFFRLRNQYNNTQGFDILSEPALGGWPFYFGCRAPIERWPQVQDQCETVLESLAFAQAGQGVGASGAGVASPPAQAHATPPSTRPPAYEWQTIDTGALGLRPLGPRRTAQLSLEIPKDWRRVSLPERYILKFAGPKSAAGDYVLFVEALRVKPDFRLTLGMEEIKAEVRPGVENWRELGERDVIAGARDARRMTLVYSTMDEPRPTRHEHLLLGIGDVLFRIQLAGPEAEGARVTALMDRLVENLGAGE
jgi:hypothetical protein